MELPEDILDKKNTDSRGRIYLGSEYKNQKVKVAILESEDQ